jgi:hypothetical protein
MEPSNTHMGHIKFLDMGSCSPVKSTSGQMTAPSSHLALHACQIVVQLNQAIWDPASPSLN